jgi:hypothetical protein
MAEIKDCVEFEVAGGLCRLQFEPGNSTGRAEDTNPGVGFILVSEIAAHRARDGKFYSGSGVFGRSDALRLRDALDQFLAKHPVDPM